MLYDFMQKEMIFNFYFDFLDMLPNFIAKPMGKCLKCFHVWVNIFIYLGYVLNGGSFNFLFFIIGLSISYHILLKNWYS